MKFEIIIKNGEDHYIPVVPNGAKWVTSRKGSPGKLTFTVIEDDTVKLTEGNEVRLSVDDTNIFHGFIFSQNRDKSRQIAVTAFDQMRYLSNKDTYVYKDKTASDVIKMIADDFRLKLGTIEQTEYKIPPRVEDNVTLFDIIYNALDLELTNNKKCTYCLTIAAS